MKWVRLLHNIARVNAKGDSQKDRTLLLQPSPSKSPSNFRHSAKSKSYLPRFLQHKKTSGAETPPGANLKRSPVCSNVYLRRQYAARNAKPAPTSSIIVPGSGTATAKQPILVVVKLA